MRKRSTKKQIDSDVIIETSSLNYNIEEPIENETEPEHYDVDSEELEN